MRCRFPLLRWGCPVADLTDKEFTWATERQQLRAENQRLREALTDVLSVLYRHGSPEHIRRAKEALGHD